ncbi:hypothetical protein LCGC14_2715250, partial [marine sediment metagenome]
MRRFNNWLSGLIMAILAIFILSPIMAFADEEVRRKTNFHQRVRSKKNLIVEKDMTYAVNANVLSTKQVNPINRIDNSEFAIWSGNSTFQASSGNTLTAIPDGWYVYSQSDFTTFKRLDLKDVGRGSGSSVYQGHNHSVQVRVGDSDTGSGVTKYLAYPTGGVSTYESWYKKFAGQSVTFGVRMKRPV